MVGVARRVLDWKEKERPDLALYSVETGNPPRLRVKARPTIRHGRLALGTLKTYLRMYHRMYKVPSRQIVMIGDKCRLGQK